jgi:hypothetical protein
VKLQTPKKGKKIYSEETQDWIRNKQMDRGKKKMEKEMMGENKEFQRTVRLAVGHSSNLRLTSFKNK